VYTACNYANNISFSVEGIELLDGHGCKEEVFAHSFFSA